LLDADFIKEVYHLNWLVNPILIPKKNKEWRMCVDYTDLNKACKKDPFRLPQIDQVMDSTIGCSLLSVLDCYSGYHQIPLKEEDQRRHLSSLCLVYFVIQLCHSDSKVRVQLIKGVYSGVYTHSSAITWKHMLLTWLSKLGKKRDSSLTWQIDSNTEKVSAITKMKPPKCLHDVQKLTGCMTTLSRFISRLGIRGLPFFKLLEKQDKFVDSGGTRGLRRLEEVFVCPTYPGRPGTP
jgi:hypothetical protein